MPIQISTISLNEARAIVNLILETASDDRGAPVAVAVVDAAARLVAFAAMDGVTPACIKLSQNKAYSAVIGQCDTRHWANFSIKNGRPDFDMRNWTDENFSGFTGGVVLRDYKQVIGAIGVSGRKGERGADDSICQDHELAEYGKTLLEKTINDQSTKTA